MREAGGRCKIMDDRLFRELFWMALNSGFNRRRTRQEVEELFVNDPHFNDPEGIADEARLPPPRVRSLFEDPEEVMG